MLSTETLMYGVELVRSSPPPPTLPVKLNFTEFVPANALYVVAPHKGMADILGLVDFLNMNPRRDTPDAHSIVVGQSTWDQLVVWASRYAISQTELEQALVWVSRIRVPADPFIPPPTPPSPPIYGLNTDGS